MDKPVGGRGKKAPYETVVLRVPKELVPEFELKIQQYRDLIINKNKKENISLIVIDKAQTIEKAKYILSQKKSAKISLIKLLQVLYNDSNISI